MTFTREIFTALTGLWNFQRTISAAGEVVGTAGFEILDANTLHYKESGTFTTCEQKNYQIFREYAYCYQGDRDKIAVYFMRNGTVDYLFHELDFTSQLIASGHHTCRKDRYYAHYEFVNEQQFIITYTVKGPDKNYIANTVFTRTH